MNISIKDSVLAVFIITAFAFIQIFLNPILISSDNEKENVMKKDEEQVSEDNAEECNLFPGSTLRTVDGYKVVLVTLAGKPYYDKEVVIYKYRTLGIIGSEKYITDKENFCKNIDWRD